MSKRFEQKLPHVGHYLPKNVFGRLSATFVSSSRVPLRGGKNTGRHIYLALKVQDHDRRSGIYECAVNIRSDEGTAVRYAERVEDSVDETSEGFTQKAHLSYEAGDDTHVQHIGLKNDDFVEIENDDLYGRISDLSHECDTIEVYGVTYSEGDGIHDIHMNHGTAKVDAHASDDRTNEDGAIAFHFKVSSGDTTKRYAHWIFIRFESQTLGLGDARKGGAR